MEPFGSSMGTEVDGRVSQFQSPPVKESAARRGGVEVILLWKYVDIVDNEEFVGICAQRNYVGQATRFNFRLKIKQKG